VYEEQFTVREHSLSSPLNENIFEERNHLVNIESYNPRSDKVDVSKAFDNKENEEVKEDNPVTDMLNFLDGIRWIPTILIETKAQFKTYQRTDKALISSSIEDDNNSTSVDIVRLLTLPFHDLETRLHDKRHEAKFIFQFAGYVGIDDKTILIHDIKKAALLGGTCLMIHKSYGKRSRYVKHLFYTIFFLHRAYLLTF